MTPLIIENYVDFLQAISKEISELEEVMFGDIEEEFTFTFSAKFDDEFLVVLDDTFDGGENAVCVSGKYS